MAKKENIHQLVVDAEQAGKRLDAFVAACLPELSRTRAGHLIREGHVEIGGKTAKPAHAVEEGDRVVVEIPAAVEPTAAPEEIPLDVIYEDDDIVVVNKAPGMVVHPAAGHAAGTLVNALLGHCADLSGVGGELKPGIVHRLDAGTSGAIIAAKNDAAHKSLAGQFKDRTVQKIYNALVFGIMRTEKGTIDSALGRSSGHRKRFSSHTKKGRTALTEWRVLERFASQLSWLEIRIRTGRTHQIRVHLTEAGHPLVGDPLYGGLRKIKRVPEGPMRDALAAVDRPILHARKLGIVHPRTGEAMEFEAPLAEDIEELLRVLRKMKVSV